jgi:hypothetical protein
MKTSKKINRKGGSGSTAVKSMSNNAKAPYAKAKPSYQQNSDSVKVTKGMKGGKKKK